MWKRREPSEPEPPEEQEARPQPGAASSPPVVDTVMDPAPPSAEPSAESDDPYAQLENFFNEPLVLEDIPVPSGPAVTQAQAPLAEPAAPPGMADTVQRLEQFGQRLAARFEALEAHVQEGSAQTLEALRRLGERMGAELAMLEKRAVNLELTMARLRSTTEALELSLRKLPDLSGSEPTASEPSSSEPVATAPEPEAGPPPAPADALFTLEEEVPPVEWDDAPLEDPPLEDPPPPDPTWH